LKGEFPSESFGVSLEWAGREASLSLVFEIRVFPHNLPKEVETEKKRGLSSRMASFFKK
jgi:hypothetical protein